MLCSYRTYLEPAAATITQHFKLMRGTVTVVPSQSVIAVVCLVKCKQFAEELCPFVLDRSLSNNNRNRPGSALLLGHLRLAYRPAIRLSGIAPQLSAKASRAVRVLWPRMQTRVQDLFQEERRRRQKCFSELTLLLREPLSTTKILRHSQLYVRPF
jgi:hypothetical protein